MQRVINLTLSLLVVLRNLQSSACFLSVGSGFHGVGYSSLVSTRSSRPSSSFHPRRRHHDSVCRPSNGSATTSLLTTRQIKTYHSRSLLLGANTILRRPTRRNPFLEFRKVMSSLWKQLHSWRILKKRLRSIVEGYTVYVLECEKGKYYVGSTSNRKQRYGQHGSNQGGSKWTKRYKVIAVIDEYRRIPKRCLLGMEATITAQYMLAYGVNSVRGSMYSQTKRLTTEHLEALVGFLGHHNELRYEDVREWLSETLPAPRNRQVPPASTKKKSQARPSSLPPLDSADSRLIRDNTTLRCYNCGKYGHKAVECKEMDQRRCLICGQVGHFAASCPDRDVQSQTGQRTSSQPEKGMRCFKCGQIGHKAANCPCL